MLAKLIVGVVMLTGVGSASFTATRAAGDCCYPGAACCFEGSPCCETEAATVKVKAKKSCCGAGAECCAEASACCAK